MDHQPGTNADETARTLEHRIFLASSNYTLLHCNTFPLLVPFLVFVSKGSCPLLYCTRLSVRVPRYVLHRAR